MHGETTSRLEAEKPHVADLPSPLFDDGWLEFNKAHWGVQPHRISLTPGGGKETWSLEGVFYTNRRGMVVLPPLNPYLPIHFSTPATRAGAKGRRWRDAAGQLATLWRDRGLGGTIALSPGYLDVRPWMWQGFVAHPRYTYHIALPLDEGKLELDVRNKVRKARRRGYVCDVTRDFKAAAECLSAPEARKGFSYRIESTGLDLMQACLGERAFFCMGCFSPAGELVGVRVIVFRTEGIALDLMAGVRTEALRDGANALLVLESLRRLNALGVRQFDFAGANLPPVAASKEAWGGELRTYFALNQRDLRYLVREASGLVTGVLARRKGTQRSSAAGQSREGRHEPGTD